MRIYLDIDGKETSAEITSETRFCSKHTGHELKCIQIRIVVGDTRENEKLLKILNKGKKDGISSTDGRGNIIDKWKVRNNSYSYSQGGYDSNYYHSVDLEQMENLDVKSIALGGLELHPYSYKEEFDDISLIIHAKVMLSKAEYSQLKKIMRKNGYFSVVRYGISDEAREMRFGLTRWSEHKEGIKHELSLVDKSYDDLKKGFSGLFNPEMYRMQDMLAEDTEILNELVDMLRNKGLLSSEEIENMRTRALERVWDRKREFYKMKNIDED